MAIVNPEQSRVSIEEFADRVVVSIPVKRNWFLLLFLGFWLCGWAMGEFGAIASIVGGAGWFLSKTKPIEHAMIPGGLFLLFWLGGWTVGGVFAIGSWLYQLKGKEIIVRDDRFISHKRDFVIFKRSKEYLNGHVKSLRVSTGSGNIFNASPERMFEFWGMGGGSIAFDYGSKTIRMGSGLQDAEVNPILEALSKFA
ncbi:MAG: hypothetical protein JWO30_1334 [Fibrobacteres bacterium]|nr:hypothetical protein [Fibrobacterota bacterium]